MSQSLWESEVVNQTQPEQLTMEPETQPAEPEQPSVESNQPESEPQSSETAPDSGALALSVDDFSALEDRILRAVSLVKRERLARSAAEERAAFAELQVEEQTPLVESLQKEVSSLHAERDDVRKRVERLLEQLDALEL